MRMNHAHRQADRTTAMNLICNVERATSSAGYGDSAFRRRLQVPQHRRKSWVDSNLGSGQRHDDDGNILLPDPASVSCAD